MFLIALIDQNILNILSFIVKIWLMVQHSFSGWLCDIHETGWVKVKSLKQQDFQILIDIYQEKMPE